jgi:hypothetical protein
MILLCCLLVTLSPARKERRNLFNNYNGTKKNMLNARLLSYMHFCCLPKNIYNLGKCSEKSPNWSTRFIPMARQETLPLDVCVEHWMGAYSTKYDLPSWGQIWGPQSQACLLPWLRNLQKEKGLWKWNLVILLILYKREKSNMKPVLSRSQQEWLLP